MAISTILLSYKEEENLRILLPQIKGNLDKLGEDYEIIVVDTAEPLDNTKEVCIEHGVRYINQEEPNFGGAFRTGIKYAIHDKFLIMDSDGAHNPKYIPDVYNAFQKGADIAIGSRYAKGGVTNDSLMSKFMSLCLNIMFRFFLGIKSKDISTDFRMYHTEKLKRVHLIRKNYDVLQEVLLKLMYLDPNNPKLVINETPISFDKRIAGVSKRRLIPFILSYIKTLLYLTMLRVKFIASTPRGRLTIKQFILYGIIGGTAAVIDFSIFISLSRTLLSENPALSNVFAGVISFCFVFICNAFFNFKKKDKLFVRLLLYMSIVVCGVVFSTLVIHLLQDYVNLSLLKAGLILFVAFFQFLFNKNVTFKD